MCHQSVGLIARHLEAAGHVTASLTSAWSITAAANPPRATFVDAPLGHTAGPPGDPGAQERIVATALSQAADPTATGIVDSGWRWRDERWKDAPLSWRRGGPLLDRDVDTRSERSADPVYQEPGDAGAAAAVDHEAQCRTCIGLPG